MPIPEQSWFNKAAAIKAFFNIANCQNSARAPMLPNHRAESSASSKIDYSDLSTTLSTEDEDGSISGNSQVAASSKKCDLSRMWKSEVFDSSQVNKVLFLRSLSQQNLRNVDDSWNHPNTSDTIRTQAPTAKGPNESSKLWEGLLYKKSKSFFQSWQPRRFKLRVQSLTGNLGNVNVPELVYHSTTKGERVIVVMDVRREKQLDSGLRVCFSVGVASPIGSLIGLDVGQARKQDRVDRVLLLAESDLEAVALLTCLRRILEPGRALPTLWDAAHFPAQALRMLE